VAAVVAPALHLEEIAPIPQSVQEGQEHLPVDARRVQVVGRHVGGGDQHAAGLEVGLKERPQHQRVPNVQDVGLVER